MTSKLFLLYSLEKSCFCFVFFLLFFCDFRGWGISVCRWGTWESKIIRWYSQRVKGRPAFLRCIFFFFISPWRLNRNICRLRGENLKRSIPKWIVPDFFFFFHLCVSHPSAPSNDDPPSVLCMWNGWPKDPKKLFPPYYFLWKESAIFKNISLYPSHFISIKHFEFVVLEECCVSSFTKPSILCVFFVFSFVCFAHW